MAFNIDENLIDTIQKSAKPSEFSLPDSGKAIVLPNGHIYNYYPKSEKELRDEKIRAQSVELRSLQGLADFVKPLMNDDSAFVIKVEGPASVTLWDYSDETDRIVHAIVIPAGLPEIPILESPVSLDDALIQMQRCFEQDTGVDEVVDILSTVKIEDLAELKDTGVSKEVVIRARVTGGKKGDANVQGLMLKPLRTFPEIEIEPSAFSFRWQRVGEKDVKARLIERQHHLWRYDQCQVIAVKIKELLPGIAVLV